MSAQSDEKLLTGYRVLLTRQPGDNREIAEMLHAQGAESLEVPALRIEPTAKRFGPPATGEGNIFDYTDVVFISRNAADYGCPLIHAALKSENPRILAVGETTARVLEQSGLAVIWPRDGVGSEALLGLPELSDWTARKVLIVRGAGGREWLRKELERRGALVDYFEVYQRQVSASTEEMLRGAIADWRPNVLFIHSADAFKNLLDAARKAGVSLQGLILVSGAERITLSVLPEGWASEIVFADSPSARDMVAALRNHARVKNHP